VKQSPKNRKGGNFLTLRAQDAGLGKNRKKTKFSYPRVDAGVMIQKKAKSSDPRADARVMFKTKTFEYS
jgi:hypothetical protein